MKVVEQSLKVIGIASPAKPAIKCKSTSKFVMKETVISWHSRKQEFFKIFKIHWGKRLDCSQLLNKVACLLKSLLQA